MRHLFENWDGSGIPGRLQQSQIPQGSRILRVLVDFFSGLARGSETNSTSALLDRLGIGAGKSYDPEGLSSLALYVRQHLATAIASAQQFVAIADLRPGMRLASDLVTTSGAFLLPGDEILIEHEIAGILQHYATDLLLSNICVYPPVGGGASSPACKQACVPAFRAIR